MKNKYLIIDGEIKRADTYVIYLIKSDDLLKVGVTTNIDKRFKAINKYRTNAELLYVSDEILNGYRVETEIHTKLSIMTALRKEWYYYQYYDTVLNTIINTVRSIGDFVSKYESPSINQINDFEKKEDEYFRVAFDRTLGYDKIDSGYDSVDIASLVELVQTALRRYNNSEASVKISNGRIYICCEYAFRIVLGMEEEYFRDWGYNIINMYHYYQGKDYLIDGDIYFSIETLREICIIFNSEATVSFRRILIGLEDIFYGTDVNLAVICKNAGLYDDAGKFNFEYVYVDDDFKNCKE